MKKWKFIILILYCGICGGLIAGLNSPYFIAVSGSYCTLGLMGQ